MTARYNSDRGWRCVLCRKENWGFEPQNPNGFGDGVTLIVQFATNRIVDGILCNVCTKRGEELSREGDGLKTLRWVVRTLEKSW